MRSLLLLFLAAPVWAQQSPPSTDIWLTPWPPRDGEVKNLTDRAGYDNQPSFTLDGTHLLYTSFRNGQTDTYSIDLASGTVTPVTQTPESEYSPTIMPDGSAFSVVRIEGDGTTRLWAFTLDGQIPVLVLPDVQPVGYHSWVDGNTVVLYLQGTPPTLRVADSKTGRATPDTVAFSVGRSLNKVPGRRAVSFVDQSDSTMWLIRTLDLDTREIEEVAPTLPGGDYFTYRPHGTILTATGASIFEWNVRRKRWDRQADFSTYGITNITRLASSPDGRFLAFVADRTP
jgi:WD40 repeat protein